MIFSFLTMLIRVIALFSFAFALASMAVPAHGEALNGSITLSDMTMLFTPAGSDVPLRVQTPSPSTAAILGRLSNGDSLIASGSLDYSRGIATLDTVDFVGLSKIIGRWFTRDSKGIMRFTSYQDVDVFSLMLNGMGGPAIIPLKSMKYTVSPSNGDDWIMFLSDQKSTQMGAFILKENSAVLKLFDAKTGDIAQVIRLQKVGN